MNNIIIGITLGDTIHTRYSNIVYDNITKLINLMKVEFTNLHFCIVNYYKDSEKNIFANFLNNLSKENANILTIRNVLLDIETQYKISIARDFHNKPCKKEINSYINNLLLDTIELLPCYNDSTNIVIIDGTNTNDMPVTQLVATLSNPPCEYDVLIAYGYDENFEISDKESFRTHNDFLGPEIVGEEFYSKEFLKNINYNYYHSKEPIRVLSCNGGITIFKKNVLHGKRFSCLPSSYLDRFYRKRCDTILTPTNYTYNNSAIGMFLFDNVSDTVNDIVFYYNTMGCNYPIVSMYTNLFIELYQLGYHNVFIYPKLKWVY